MEPKKDLPLMSGIGLSPGIGIGTAYCVEPRIPTFYRIRITPEEVPDERTRFDKALEQSRGQLRNVKTKFEAEVGKEHSHIIDAHLLILEDRQFLEEIEGRITEQCQSPERAVREIADQWISVYRSLHDPFFQERGSDVDEVAERLVSNLMELRPRSGAELPEDLILVAPKITLSVLAEYPLGRVKGLVVKKGGSTSHTVIIARSYQIPVVTGIGDAQRLIRTGDPLIIDGLTGTVQVHPSPVEVRDSQVRVRAEEDRKLRMVGDPSPCHTSDGRRVLFYANAETDSEVGKAMRLGAEGIGLFRSEYIYMQDRTGPASEEEQFRSYKNLAQTVSDRPAIVRTLDLGDEQHPYFSRLSDGPDSALGLRGIRLSLRYPEIYKSQVRAILRARQHGNLKIVLPMVSSVEEMIQGRELIQEVHVELRKKGMVGTKEVEVGVMVELPAAIVLLEEISAHADFFAVGSNDLIQYTLAAGRNDDSVAYLFSPLHPAVLRGLNRVAHVASEKKYMALVCGEVASHPVYASLLVGMGFQHLSMNPFAVPDIKQIIRETSYSLTTKIVDQLLNLSTTKEVQAHIKAHFSELSPANVE